MLLNLNPCYSVHLFWYHCSLSDSAASSTRVPQSETFSHCRSSVVWWFTVKSNTSNSIWGAAGTQWKHWTPRHPLEIGCFKKWWDSAPNLVLQRIWNVAALWISPQWLPQRWWWPNLTNLAEEKSIKTSKQLGPRTSQLFLLRSSPKEKKNP